MKTVIYTLLLCFCVGPFVAAQDRSLYELRKTWETPRLIEYEGLGGIAAGIAQSPEGYPVMLYEPLPVASTVGIYGNNLADVSEIQITTEEGRELRLPAVVFPMGFFKIDILHFRLPGDVRGEIWIKAVSRTRESNLVRLFVKLE